jgi:hypothetical protein
MRSSRYVDQSLIASNFWIDSQLCTMCHVTQLKKGVKVPETEVITEVNAWIEPDFSIVEHPLRVLDQKERKTRRHTVKMYKIQWSHHKEEEAFPQHQVSRFSSIAK